MSKITTSNFQKGIFIIFKGEPHQITEFQFVNPGKGSAFVRTKLKSLKTGRVQEFTYKSGEQVEEYSINVKEMQYLYKAGDNFCFMDLRNFEQINISKDKVGSFSNFIKEGETYQVLLNEGNAIGMRYPKKVQLKVTEAEEGVKGSTVSGARKSVLVETGVRINVPLFIKAGETIIVDPATGEYVERASQK